MPGYEPQISWNGNATYRASFRLSHPCLDPRTVTAALSLQPDIAVKVGDRRRTPKGRSLDGCHKKSYWSCRIVEGGHGGGAIGFMQVLDDFVTSMASAERFLAEVRAGGGECDLFVGWFLNVFAALEIEHGLLAKLANLGIDFTVDIYAGDNDRV